MIAKNIMKTKVITVSPTAPITEAALLMRDEDIGALIVVNDIEEPIGIITDRDIVVSVLAENKDPGEVIVEDVMTRKLHIVQEDTNVFDILRILSRNSIRRVPVTRKGKLTGIISVDDIVVVVATELANLASALTGGISRTL
ncbi:MAG: CBS domain-containing protein [Deltaproteobacteria bacterium]|nr:CBS domain-containing protein [Deltaproteobacteria bacterium]